MSVYTYAVADMFDRRLVEGLSGVDGASVHLVGHRDLVAVASVLPQPDLQSRLETLDGLETLARAHHAVVAAVAAHTATLPLRLATVHYGDERVVEVLRQGYREFRATLDRLAGRVEVGVKVYVCADPAAEPATAPAASGRDYLRQRQRQRHLREDSWQEASATASRLDARLAALAVDRRQHRPQNARLSGARGENVLNAAYLVDAGQAAHFADLASGLGEAGVRVEVTGPWAPYSFAAPDSLQGSA